MSGAVSGAVVSLLLDGGSDEQGATTSGPAPIQQQRVIVAEESAVSDAVAAALPAVVTVLVQEGPHQNDAGQTVEGIAAGSGFIVDTRGFVVTNEHVVRYATNISVLLSNGQQRPAELVAQDAPFTDVAVLHIQGGGLQSIRFGDSEALVMGQRVAALGAALFDFQPTVTEGVVSGLHRRLQRNGSVYQGVYLEDLIQTDAALNNGNSGGPLINTRSEVVGINTNVVRQAGTAETVYGISFALSSNVVAPIISSIIDTGSYPRPYVGIDHLDLDATVAQDHNLPVDHGALVQRVIAGGPADLAGIEAGDIILSLGDQTLSSDLPFINALGRLAVDATVDVQLLRAGQLQDVTLQVRPR